MDLPQEAVGPLVQLLLEGGGPYQYHLWLSRGSRPWDLCLTDPKVMLI